MPTLLTRGPIHTIIQNAVYALPANASYIFTNTALEISNVEAFTTSQAVSINSPVVAAGGFVRCTTSNAVVRVTAIN